MFFLLANLISLILRGNKEVIKMIIKFRLIEQSYSGKYQEAIFDVDSTRNSADWTYVEFIKHLFFRLNICYVFSKIENLI